jgi:hypothetical protein
MGELIGLVSVLGAFGIPMLVIWSKHREKMIDRHVGATAEASAERAAQYASHVQELEDRVRVLERIVTDRGYDVATQIEALRDTRRVEELDAGVPLGFEKQEQA